MSGEAVNLAIEKNNTLRDVENSLSKLKDNVTTVNLRLPRHHKMVLFKDSWITSLISTASQGRELNITDWNQSDDISNIKDRFSNSLIGITSALLANEISNSKRQKFHLNINDIIEHVVYEQNGMIEDHESGKSFVFCSFDSNEDQTNFPGPLALTASTKEEFVRKFLDIKREKIDYVSKNGSHQLSFTHEFDRELASLIFELYENTSQHGKYDEKNKIIKGVRSFSIKRHSSHDTRMLIDQANDFDELQKYIISLRQKKNLHFYEISISDNGLGIVGRLQVTRPSLLSNETFQNQSQIEKLNHIIANTLSSKLYPGSGLGLTIALRNLANLKGFLSLRTGNQWAHFDGSNHQFGDSARLQQIKNSNGLSNIKGTHYNILIPFA